MSQSDSHKSKDQEVQEDRALHDMEAKTAAHRFVLQHFGGDYQRAVWFLTVRARLTLGESAETPPTHRETILATVIQRLGVRPMGGGGTVEELLRWADTVEIPDLDPIEPLR